MSGTVLPRENLAAPPAIDASQVKVTNSLIDFLRAELRTYKATVRKGGGSFTDDKLAMEIQYCPALTSPPEFSPETLRRFLKNIPQKQGDDFFQAIIAFLLHEKWIAPADLTAHDKDVFSRAAVAMQGFLGGQPSETTIALYRQLEGTYVRYALGSGRIVRIGFTVSVRHDPPLLRASEELLFYSTMAAEHILRETGGLHPDSYRTLARLLGSHARQEGSSRFSLGFGIVDSDATAFLVRSELTGGGTIYLVNSLSHNEKKRVGTIRATRYTGMTAGGTEGDFELYRSYSDLAGPISTRVD